MPLFRRPDGDVIRGGTPLSRIMAHVLRGRNESAIYHQTIYEISHARAWLKAYNRCHEQRATLFHLFAYACGKTLHERPGLNRFVSGGRVYQRKGVSISFTIKRELRDDSPVVTVKLDIPKDEPFDRFVARVVAAIDEGRTNSERPVDKEIELFARLPGPLVTIGDRIVRWLDRMNLLPWFMMRDDPLYASLFLVNLGSIGISDTYHHLYEYGNTSLFGVLSSSCRIPVVEGDKVVIQEALRLHWTFDERINDGFYCGKTLAIVQTILEDPDHYVGAPDAAGAEPLATPRSA
jgi:pyruvate/2-oxoglutarate dehydrogenase complex dihydrolipoamide acyltransferase (E2) component